MSSRSDGSTTTPTRPFCLTFLLARRWAVIVSKILPLLEGKSKITERAISSSLGVLAMIWLCLALRLLPSFPRSFFNFGISEVDSKDRRTA